MRKTIFLFAALLFFTAQAYPQKQKVVATPANDFLNSMGVNTSINVRGENIDTTVATVKYLGVRWLRCVSDNMYCNKLLYTEAGVRFSLSLPAEGDVHTARGIEQPDGITRLISKAHRLVKEVAPDALIAFEGCNEPNNWKVTYHGIESGGQVSWRELARYHRDMYQAVKADLVLRNYPVWSFSETGGAFDNMGVQFLKVPENAKDVDPEFHGAIFADYATCHNYFIHPQWPPHSNNQTWLASDPSSKGKADNLYGNFGLTWAKKFKGYTDKELLTLPKVTTETGTTITSPFVWDGKNHQWTDKPNPEYDNPSLRITEEDQALMFLSCYLAQFKRGWKYTAMYILRDRSDEEGNQSFGFFRPEWNEQKKRYASIPRLAAHYMHNFTTILADKESIKTPATLVYSITPRPETAHDLLLQKSDGTLMLIVWGEKYEYGAKPDNVEVKFEKKYQEVRIYNPAQYDPANPEKGTQPVRTEKNIQSLSLSMLNNPYIIEIIKQ